MRVEGAARFGELFPPVAQRLLDLHARRHRRLIGQRNPAVVATPLVVDREKRGPARIRRGHRVDGHHIAVPRIREQRLAVLQYAIPHIQHVIAIAGVSIIRFAEGEVLGQHGGITLFGEGPQAERVAAGIGNRRVLNDLVRGHRVVAANQVLQIEPPERAEPVDHLVANRLVGNVRLCLASWQVL